MKKYLQFLVFAAVIVACSPSKDNGSEEVSLKDQVMNVHDEVMPKAEELMKTKKLLLAKADSMMQDSLVAAKCRVLAHNLEVADEEMRTWMHQFNPNFDGTEEELTTYMEEQLKGIERVKADMEKALEEGKKAL